MRFSLFYNFDLLPGKSVTEMYREVEAQAVVADTLGFDAIWLAEHHFELYGRMPDPLLYLARLSGITKQIGLGTAIIEAPHYNPLRLAEDATLLDVLSNGRVRLGVGSGAANKPAEFAHFGIPLEQKSARTLEIIEILRQAFDDGRIDFEGSFYHYKDVEIHPRPVQNARQLLWLASFFPLYLNTFAGIRNVDRKLIEIGRVYRLSQSQLLVRVILPAALPEILTGVRYGLSVAWLALVLAELLGAQQGLGYLLSEGREFVRVDIVLCSILVFALAGKAVDLLVRGLEAYFLRWRDTYKG